MTTQAKIEGNALIVERIYDASRTETFDAWIDAAKTTHWWGCGQTSKVSSTIDRTVGGRYHHLMTIEGVGDHLIDGEIVEYDPPHSLSYTLPGFEEGAEMTVRVTFAAIGDRTKVTLTQSPLPDFLHEPVTQGWTASFERLADFFNGARRAA